MTPCADSSTAGRLSYPVEHVPTRRTFGASSSRFAGIVCSGATSTATTSSPSMRSAFSSVTSMPSSASIPMSMGQSGSRISTRVIRRPPARSYRLPPRGRGRVARFHVDGALSIRCGVSLLAETSRDDDQDVRQPQRSAPARQTPPATKQRCVIAPDVRRPAPRCHAQRVRPSAQRMSMACACSSVSPPPILLPA